MKASTTSRGREHGGESSLKHARWQARRDRLVIAGLNGYFKTLSTMWRMAPEARQAMRDVEVTKDLRYGQDSAHRLDIYRSRIHQGVRPAVLYVHGGGFRLCSKDTHWPMALAFARRGYTVFNINYRLSPQHRYPAALEDLCQAYRWMLNELPRWGADPARVVLAGESAGANLVTALAVATSYPRPEDFAQTVWDLEHQPAAVVAACGLLQVSDPQRFARRRAFPRWVGERLASIAGCYLPVRGPSPLADPLNILEQESPQRPLPPFFAPVGTRDPLLDDTRRLGAAFSRHGATCEVAIYPGQIHAFHVMLWKAVARQCWRDQFEFLAEHL